MYMNESRYRKLKTAIDWSVDQLTFPKKKRHAAVQQFCGSHYAEGGAEKVVPVNYLALAVSVFVRRLAAKSPKVFIDSHDNRLKPLAHDLSLAVNLVPDEIELTATLRRWVTEAMFSPWGIIKCGISGGNTFADLVGFGNYFIDMSPDRIEEIDFEGNDYWEDYDVIMEDKRYINKDGMRPDERTSIGINGEDHIKDIQGQGTASTFRDKKQLRDIWIPDKGLLVTCSIHDDKVIRETDLDELRHSPYYRLSYNQVPGQLMPLPQVALWKDLHDLANSLFRKLADGADSQKQCLGFNNDDESVLSFRGARDGDGFGYHGAPPLTLKAGGIDEKTLYFFQKTQELASYFSGNLDSLGGLGAQADTATQDKLISQAANAQLDDMSDVTIAAVKRLFEAISYYEYTDPMKKRILQKKIPGTDMSLPVEFGPSQRQNANHDAFQLSVDVCSMQSDSPSVKLQKLRAFLQEFILPLEPFISAAGGTVNVRAILEKAGQYANFEEIEDLVVFVEALSAEPGAAAAGGGGVDSTLTYNGSGPSQKSQNAMAMQGLMSNSGE